MFMFIFFGDIFIFWIIIIFGLKVRFCDIFVESVVEKNL